jgi:hypothetical protein
MKRPIDEVTLGDLLTHLDNALSGQWSPYTPEELRAEMDRRRRLR